MRFFFFFKHVNNYVKTGQGPHLSIKLLKNNRQKNLNGKNNFTFALLQIVLVGQISKYMSIWQVAFVNGISMGGGASFIVPMTFSVVTEKVVCGTYCLLRFMHHPLVYYLS